MASTQSSTNRKEGMGRTVLCIVEVFTGYIVHIVPGRLTD